MKVSWRLAAEQKPSDDREVLGSFTNGSRLICYYDGEVWVDSATENIISSPVFWMHIPLLPFE